MKKLFESLSLDDMDFLGPLDTELETEFWNLLGPTNGKYPPGIISDMSLIKKAFSNLGIGAPSQFEIGKAQGILGQVFQEISMDESVKLDESNSWNLLTDLASVVNRGFSTNRGLSITIGEDFKSITLSDDFNFIKLKVIEEY